MSVNDDLGAFATREFVDPEVYTGADGAHGVEAYGDDALTTVDLLAQGKFEAYVQRLHAFVNENFKPLNLPPSAETPAVLPSRQPLSPLSEEPRPLPAVRSLDSDDDDDDWEELSELTE